MDRGILNFFKDGKDLGQAVCQPELKTGKLFPFIQIQEVALLSIFHPTVYPLYRDPVIAKEEEIKEPEPQPRRLSATKKKSSVEMPPPKSKKKQIRQSYKEMRKSLTKKQAKILQKKGYNPSDRSSYVSKQSSQMSSVYIPPQTFLNQNELSWNNLSNIDRVTKKTSDQGMDSLILNEKIEFEKRQMQLKDAHLQQIRDSHKKKEEEAKQQDNFYAIDKVSDSVDVNVQDLDMNNLILQKN